MLNNERAAAISKTAVVGGLVDFSLSLSKVLTGTIWHSQALIADGIHSISDLMSDLLVWYVGRHASQEPDLEHPYGHGRYETLATLALGSFLLLVAIGICWDAVERLFMPEELLEPQPLALAAAFLSILIKEWQYWWTLSYARRVRSELLRANAWHHRSDAMSSVVVLVGVGGTLAGLPYLDAIATVLVALMIAHIAWTLGKESIVELVDTGLAAERLSTIKKTITNVGGVRNIHMLRTRKLGGSATADVHVLVDPRLSVSEGHMIALLVENQLKEEIDEISDVTVHIDPEDDEIVPQRTDLPTRTEALSRLDRHWEMIPEAKERTRTILHYLNGRIDVEVYLPLDISTVECSHALSLRQLLQSSVADDPVFDKVFVYFG